MLGLTSPRKPTILGNDFAGVVETVGSDITEYKIGDKVYGTVIGGAFAEYICVDRKGVASKPTNTTFEQAAGMGCAGLTALQSIRAGGLKNGEKQRVLINGAAGGIGTFAVQIAKDVAKDVHVTGVCSTRNVEMVKSLGADTVVDYTTQDVFATFKEEGKYDVILDMIGNHTFDRWRGILAPCGTYVPVGGPGGGLLGSFANSLVAYAKSWFMKHNVALVMSAPNKEDLETLREMVEEGKVRVVVDRVVGFTEEEVRKAVEYAEEGHVRGKIIIKIV